MGDEQTGDDEVKPPWDEHEGESVAVGDFRRLAAGSGEREVMVYQILNDLWNMVDTLMGRIDHLAGHPDWVTADELMEDEPGDVH